MRRRRTVLNEKDSRDYTCGGKIPITKTIPLLMLSSLKRKLSWGVWKNRSLSLQSWKHVEETLIMERHPVVIFPRKRLISFSGGIAMEVVYPRCSGLDVHKRFVVACLSIIEKGQRHKELRQFSTMTNEILMMKEWLKASGCTHIAMESTGVYWKPIFHLLEGEIEAVLVNAQHMKAVPGRKTDVKDAEWIADLLQHGLLKASFIPGSEHQAVRDLTRTRMRLTQERTRLINRIQKVLEDANIKLASVVSDIMGVSGQAILMALLAGQEDPERLAHLARGSLVKKEDQLQAASTSESSFLIIAWCWKNSSR